MVRVVYKPIKRGLIILVMTRKKEDVDLALSLMDPGEARRYIAEFNFGSAPNLRPEHLVLEGGDEIIFKTMSDQDAVRAAKALLNVEIQRVLQQLSYEKHIH